MLEPAWLLFEQRGYEEALELAQRSLAALIGFLALPLTVFIL